MEPTSIDLVHPIQADDWEYVGAGSANIVFAYSGKAEKLQGKVIRLRMEDTKLSTLEIYKYLKSASFDELRVYFVKMALVKIDSTVLSSFQRILWKQKLQIGIDLNENHALILDNVFTDPMTHYTSIEINKYYKFFVHKTGNEVIFEFKPKWLNDAPSHHLNCRNCINAMLKNQNFVYCHLKMFMNEYGIKELCTVINEELSKKGVNIPGLYKDLETTIQKNFNVINILRELQNKINIHQALDSLSSVDDVTEELLFNMTLRDVSLIYNLKKGSVRILDLDKKPADKWESWKLQDLKYYKEYMKPSNLNCGIKTSVKTFISDP